MAIEASFTHHDMTFTKAYLMIKKIVLGNTDEEYFYPDSFGNEVLAFRKINEAMAIVFIYGDKIARENGVHPIHSFTVEFNYDIENGGNIYREAYSAVKNSELLNGLVWEDV